MNMVRRIVVGLAGVVVIALVLELAAPNAVHAVANLLVTVTNTPNVNVVNTPSVNVASLPAVQFSGTPSVNANITNGSVPVTLSGNVPIANPVDNSNNPIPVFVRDADNGARQPFTAQCNASLPSGVCQIATVPAGKELVIEMFNMIIGMVSGDRPWGTELRGKANAVGYFLSYPLSFDGHDSGTYPALDNWVVAQPLTRAYADPNTTVTCEVDVNLGEAVTEPTCVISGYLVNLP